MTHAYSGSTSQLNCPYDALQSWIYIGDSFSQWQPWLHSNQVALLGLKGAPYCCIRVGGLKRYEVTSLAKRSSSNSWEVDIKVGNFKKWHIPKSVVEVDWSSTHLQNSMPGPVHPFVSQELILSICPWRDKGKRDWLKLRNIWTMILRSRKLVNILWSLRHGEFKSNDEITSFRLSNILHFTIHEL